jgi:hypothetical protein
MRVRPQFVLVALLLSALALTAAGCGKKKNAAATTTTTAASTEMTSTESTTTTAETTSTSETSTTDTSSASTTGVTPNIAAFLGGGKCAQLAQTYANYGQAIAAASTGNGAADVQKEAEAFKSFADNAPSEIKGDFEVVADALQKYATAMQGFTPGQTPSASELAKLSALSNQIDSQKLSQASSNIGAWVQKNCSTGTP